MPLDFFVLFSTTVAIFGNVGQANHAAANTFLDALAHYRQSLGLPAQTINWGAWSEVGAAAERQVGQTLTAGVGTISPAAGIAALQTLLGQNITQAVVVPLAWDKLPAGITTRPLVQELVEKVVESAPQTEAGGRSWLAQVQAETHPKKRHALLTQLVQEQLAQVLGFAAGQFTNWQAGFFELGMDSLTAMEFKNKLQSQVGQPLSPTLAFDYPQVESLVGYLASFFEEAPQVKEEPAAGLEQLSEDELASLLDAELEDL
jgi:acyl carrier protein